MKPDRAEGPLPYSGFSTPFPGLLPLILSDDGKQHTVSLQFHGISRDLVDSDINTTLDLHDSFDLSFCGLHCSASFTGWLHLASSAAVTPSDGACRHQQQRLRSESRGRLT